MTIDVVNVDSYAIKSALLGAFGNHNDVKVNPVISSLSFETICDKNVMLQDPLTKSGIVFTKVMLSELFPKTISIRPFKQTLKVNTQTLSPDEVDALNEKYGIELTNVEKDVLKGMTQVSKEVIRDFILFCRVYGFYELDIGDVSIYEHDGILTISVNDTNKLFTGYIEVLV